MTKTIAINQIIDPSQARVIVTRDAAGALLDARFDLSGLPRVDGVLVGRPVAEVPALVERLCGICPVAHHLAGVAALESLGGLAGVTPTVGLVRRLLNHGAVIATHALGFLDVDRDAVIALRRFGTFVQAAAGSPKHFPTTAVPGAVLSRVSTEQAAGVADAVPAALAAALGLARGLLDQDRPREAYAGADVALVDEAGRIDLLGSRLRAVAADGRVLVDGARADEWDTLVAEAVPGDAAPRLYLTALGPQAGGYRTGPVAQLRVGELATPQAAGLQRDWLAGPQRADAARAVLMVHCVEAIGELAHNPLLTSDDIGEAVVATVADGVGTGWVDTGRGLLVHRYVGGADGLMASASILTPTAQNEPWMAALLRQAASSGIEGTQLTLAMEDAIREADPCLPCTSAPIGQMGLAVDTVVAKGA